MTINMGSRERSREGNTNVWLTPRYILADLGPFDLDPCAAGGDYAWRPWDTAKEHYTWGGLDKPWHGMVWVNPPYGPHAADWLKFLADYNHGMALTFARTETESFFKHVWTRSAGILFVKRRIHFHRPDGSKDRHTAAPSVLIGYGDEALRRLANTKIEGHLVLGAAIIIGSDGKPCETWRQVIKEAMAGKTMKLRDIYQAVDETSKVRYSKANGVEWQAKIRRVLQEHFQPVARGVWAPA